MAKYGIAFTSKQRRTAALQAAVEAGHDPSDLKYVEDKASKTGRVIDKNTGRTLNGLSW